MSKKIIFFFITFSVFCFILGYINNSNVIYASSSENLVYWNSNEGFEQTMNNGAMSYKFDFALTPVYLVKNADSSYNITFSTSESINVDTIPYPYIPYTTYTIIIEDENGKTYPSSGNDYTSHHMGTVNYNSLPQKFKVKVLWQTEFRNDTSDDSVTLVKMAGESTTIKDADIEEWKASQPAIVKNSFVAPDGTIHQFIPGIEASFNVYSSDGKSLINSYKAFPDNKDYLGYSSYKPETYKINALLQFLENGRYYLFADCWCKGGGITNYACGFIWDNDNKKFVLNNSQDFYTYTNIKTIGKNGFQCFFQNSLYTDYYHWGSDKGFNYIGRFLNFITCYYLGYDCMYMVMENGTSYYSYDATKINDGTWTSSGMYADIPKYLREGGWSDVISGRRFELISSVSADFIDVGNPLIVDTRTINGIEYQKSITDTYIPKNSSPTIKVNKPTLETNIYGENSQIDLEFTVSDADNNTLTCKYYIDSETEPREVRDNITNTTSGQPVSFNLLSTNNLSEGSHTIRFVVSDGRSETSQQCSFMIDKTPPTSITLNTNITESKISVSVSATDNAAGLDSAPYHYTVISTQNTVASAQSQWTADTSYTFGSLMPNTQYKITVEAKDRAENISSKEQLIYTKAQITSISTNTPGENSLNIALSDTNPVSTLYQIMFENKYVSQSGVLTTTPSWINVPGKSITVTGLSQNTTYQIRVKAKNDDGVENAFSSEITGITLASSPSNITFIPTQATMTIKWDAVLNAISYNVEKDGVVVGNITGTSYIHTGLTSETSHNYRISVNNVAGTGSWSGIYTKSTCPYPPVIPVNFAITDISQNYISLSWDPSVKASEYVIEVNGKEVGTYTTTAALIQNLTPNTQYKFRIRSSNVGGDSAWSDYLTETTWPVIPEIPSNITVRKTNISADISWNSSERADGYEIETDGTIIDTGSKQEYRHEGLNALSAHNYRVRAYNRGGKSEWSEVLEVTTNPDKPTVPNNIMATTDKNYTTLTWYLVPYAEYYDIEIDSKDVVTVTDLSARINGLQPGTTHSYRVSARNETGSSDWSEYVTISTLPEADQAMTTITNVVAVVTNSYITIAWDDVDTDAEYEIEVDKVLQDIGKDRVFNHTGLSANQYHTYKVKAKTTDSQEYWCAVLSLSTLPDPPDAPTGVEAMSYDRQIEIKWNKSDNLSYDIEVDGEIKDNGQNNSYTDQNLNPGTDHTYRVRAKNASGVTAWSPAITKSTTLPEYTVKCTKGGTFDFSILASNVQDFTGLRFVVSFNEDDLDIEDLCSFTPEKKTTQNGTINGTKFTVTRETGKIIITVKENIVPGTSWSGELDNIIFKSMIDGETKISVTVDDK